MRELLIIHSSTLLPPNPTLPTSNNTKLSPNTTKHSPLKPSYSTKQSATSFHPPLLKNFRQSPLKYYADLASNLAEDGRLEEFVMIAESLLVYNNNDSSLLFVESLNVKLVSVGVTNLICDGRLDSVLECFSRVDKLGIVPKGLVNKSVRNLFALECRRLVKSRKVKEAVALMESLSGFLFPVKGFLKPSEIFDLCLSERDPDTAVRYASLLPHAHTWFSSIILGFGKKGDLKSALIAYETSKSKIDSPNMYVCRTMIDVCGLCGNFFKSRYIYESLLAQKVIPNTYFFNSLMNVNAHDLSYTLNIYKHMKNLGVAPDLASYNILLKVCCHAGRVDLAQDIYEEVRSIALTGALKLDVITYSTLIKVLADAKMWQMALKIKEHMLSAGVTPNIVTWSSLISACANAGLVEQAIQVLEEMLLAGCEPNSQCCNNLLYACVEACQYDRAFRIFESWRESGFLITSHTTMYNGNTNNNLCIGAADSSENGITNLRSCYSSPYMSFAKSVPFAPTIATFNILMKACGTDYYRAKTLMDEIKLAGLSPNQISWSIMIDICGRTGNVGGSIQALKAMRDNSIKPDVIAYTTVIKACVENGSLKLAFSLFEEMKRYGVKPNLVTYNTLLRARSRYGSLHEVKQCLAIYQHMRKAGYSPYDYFLKELVEEWCEGVITYNNQDECVVGLSDLLDKTDREKSQSLLLEKVAAHLQRDIAQSVAVDLRGLTKVEARIVVLAVLRMIKEKYRIGDPIKDDVDIILEVREESAGATNYFEVQDAVVKLLRDELGLCIILTGPRVSPIRNDVRNPPDTDLIHKKVATKVIESSARRPAILRRVKVTRESMYQWLQKRVGR